MKEEMGRAKVEALAVILATQQTKAAGSQV